MTIPLNVVPAPSIIIELVTGPLDGHVLRVPPYVNRYERASAGLANHYVVYVASGRYTRAGHVEFTYQGYCR